MRFYLVKDNEDRRGYGRYQVADVTDLDFPGDWEDAEGRLLKNRFSRRMMSLYVADFISARKGWKS